MPNRAIERCRQIAAISEIPGQICRTFLCPCTYQVHALLREWMEAEGMEVWVDHAGNLHGLYPGAAPEAPRLLIGSHIDTVPNAGPFDGVLGVVLGIEIVAALQGRRLPSALEVIAFSEEEGVRFGVPFIGSRALIGTLDEILERTDAAGITLADALLPQPHAALAPESRAYFEIHIEQGPVLESLDLPMAVTLHLDLRRQGQSRGHHAHAPPR